MSILVWGFSGTVLSLSYYRRKRETERGREGQRGERHTHRPRLSREGWRGERDTQRLRLREGGTEGEGERERGREINFNNER